MKEVIEYANKQTKTLGKALTQATGNTAAEWPRSENLKLQEDLEKTRTSLPKDPTLFDEEDDLNLPDDWIDRYVAGLEEPRPQSVGKGVTQIEL